MSINNDEDNPKPFSPACERNKIPILAALKQVITDKDRHLLEVGSGTGQHAVFMAPHFPWLTWHTSDLPQNHASITAWIEESGVSSIRKPLRYEAGRDAFPTCQESGSFDVVYAANTLHIMSWERALALIADLGAHVRSGGRVVFYGPFNYGGQYTSPSNAAFDAWLKQQDAESGIRDFEAVSQAMQSAGFQCAQDISMPAKNRVLVFRRGQATPG